MQISSNLKTLIEAGYTQYCRKIKYLVGKRINTNSVEILEDYIKEQRSYVESYCAKHNIDLVNIITSNADDKATLGLSLIENEIMTMIGTKSKYDSELKPLNIKTERILNGVQNAGWLALFNSPNNLAWFVKRTDKIIECLDSNNKWYDFIIQTVETIKGNWIDPQSVKPNLDDYWQLMDLEVPDEVKDLVLFHSGN